MTLTLKAVIPFFHRTPQLMILYYQTKFGCKRTSSLEDTAEIILFWLCKPSLWPWHWTQWTNFSAWHWLMMLHNHTTFGNKMFCGSEDSVRTNIHWHFEPLLWPWPWTQSSHFSTEHSGFWCCTIKPSLAAKKKTIPKQQSKRFSRNSHILIT